MTAEGTFFTFFLLHKACHRDVHLLFFGAREIGSDKSEHGGHYNKRVLVSRNLKCELCLQGRGAAGNFDMFDAKCIKVISPWADDWVNFGLPVSSAPIHLPASPPTAVHQATRQPTVRQFDPEHTRQPLVSRSLSLHHASAP